MRLIDFDKLTETVKECSGSWTLPQQEGAELMLDIAEFLAEDKPIFCIQREEFKGTEDTCDKWQEKHKERNC